MLKKSIVLFVLLLVSACSSMPSWLGGGEEDEKLEGERISVLKEKSSLEAEPRLEKYSVEIKTAEKNNVWYKSSGFDINIPQNLSSTAKFSGYRDVSAGDGGTEIEPITYTPVIAEGVIYTLDEDGEVKAFEVNNIKNNLWTYEIETTDKKKSFANGGISYARGRLFITTDRGLVIALDAKTGEEIWQRDLINITRAAPATKDNMIFVNTINNRLYALSAEDGSVLWVSSGIYENSGIVGTGSPVIDDEIIYIPYSSGELYALSFRDGREVWSASYVPVSGGGSSFVDIDASPVIFNNLIIAVSNDGVLAATNKYTGQRLWETEIASVYTPWVAGDYLFVIGNDERLYAVHIISGLIKWIVNLEKFNEEEGEKLFWSGPTMVNSELVVVNSKGMLLRVNPNDGKIIGKMDIPDGIYSAPITADEKMFLYSNDANLIEIE